MTIYYRMDRDLLEQVMGLYNENREVHGKDHEEAMAATLQDVNDAATAIPKVGDAGRIFVIKDKS